MRAVLGVFGAALVAAGCSSAPGPVGSGAAATGQPSAPPSPIATEPPPTALQLALDGIKSDGTYSKDTALAVFVASFGPLPGVNAPTSTEDVGDGTLAIDMVAAHWDELTADQRAAIRDWLGSDAGDALPAAYVAGSTLAIDRAAVDSAVAEIAAHVGHGLALPVTIVPPDPAILKKHPSADGWTFVAYNATGQTPLLCRISIVPRIAAAASTLRFTLLHELWHCFQGALVDEKSRLSVAPWLKEGEAEWVAETITNGAGGLGQEPLWERYILHPDTALLKRSYDAEGFFSQLGYAGLGPWKLVEPMFAAVDSHRALQVANVNDPAFLDGWGSSFFRDGQPSADWAMTNADGIVPMSTATAEPGSLTIADEGDELLEAPALTVKIAKLHTTAFVTHIETIGSGRVGDPAGGGLDEKLDGGKLDLCTNQSGDCTCPPGTVEKPSPRKAPQDLRLAVSAGDGADAQLIVTGIPKSKWCLGSALNLTVEGEIAGQRYSGLIVGFPAPRLTCDPLGQGNAVHWIGQAANTHNEIGGEFDMEFGTWTVGTAVGDRSFSIFGQGVPRQYLGGISGTVTQSQTGGSIDATAANGPDVIHIKGTWTCPGPGPAPSQ